MITLEDLPASDTYLIGKEEWKASSEMPDIWKIVHQCEAFGINIHFINVIVDLFVYLKQHKLATVEDFLQKFKEGNEQHNFFDFNEYFTTLYRQVLQQQSAMNLNSIERDLISERMSGANEMQEFVCENKLDRDNSYWKTEFTLSAPDDRELPRRYRDLLETCGTFERFLKAHARYGVSGEQLSSQADSRTEEDVGKKIRDVLNKR